MLSRVRPLTGLLAAPVQQALSRDAAAGTSHEGRGRPTLREARRLRRPTRTGIPACDYFMASSIASKMSASVSFCQSGKSGQSAT